MDLHVGQDHRPPGAGQERRGLIERLAEGVRIAGRQPLGQPVGSNLPRMRLVAGKLQVDRPLVPLRGFEHAINLAECRLGPIKNRRGDRDLLENLELRVKIFHLMVQERIARSFRHPGRAGEDDHGRLLGVSAGDAVTGAQSTHAVGDANTAQPVNPGIGIRGEPGGVLASHPHQADRALLQQPVQAEHIITWNPKDMLDPARGKPVDQILTDRQYRGSCLGFTLGQTVASRFQGRGARHQRTPCWFPGGAMSRTRLVLFQRGNGPMADRGTGLAYT